MGLPYQKSSYGAGSGILLLSICSTGTQARSLIGPTLQTAIGKAHSVW